MVTVGDLIRFGSHVEGGVHVAKPSSKIEERLARLIPAFLGRNFTAEQLHYTPLGNLAVISDVTVNGLQPLRDAIAADGANLLTSRPTFS